MRTVTCDTPDCQSYYQFQESAQNVERALWRAGWTGDSEDSKHYCPACSLRFDAERSRAKNSKTVSVQVLEGLE